MRLAFVAVAAVSAAAALTPASGGRGILPSVAQCTNRWQWREVTLEWVPPQPWDDVVALDVTFAPPGGGFVGFGIRNGAGMVGADIWAVHIATSPSLAVAVDDRMASAQALPPLDAQQDVALVAATLGPNGTTATLERAVNTGDASDHAFTTGSGLTPIAVSFGTGSLAYHGADRTVTSLPFFAFTNAACSRATVTAQLGPAITVSWSPIAPTDRYVVLTLRFACLRGWMGFGLRRDAASGMVGADIWYFVYDSATSSGSVTDMHVGAGGPPPQVDAQQDVKLLASWQTANTTVFVVKRALATNDTGDDRAFNTSGPTPVLVAWSLTALSAGYHGMNRLPTTIDFTAACTPAARTVVVSPAITITWTPPPVRSPDAVVQLTITYASSFGWFGLGIRNETTGGMAGMDVWIFQVDANGTLTVTDARALAQGVVQVDAQQDVHLVSWAITNDSMIATVQRSARSSDVSGDDNALAFNGSTPIAVAWGSSASPTYHTPSNRTRVLIDFFASSCDESAYTNDTAAGGGGGATPGAGNGTSNGTASADGGIAAATAGTHRNVTVNALISLAWVPPGPADTHINVTFLFRSTAGWMALGLRSGQGMVGSDIWLLRFPAALAAPIECYDALATDYVQPAPDVSQDLELVASARGQGWASATLRRRLDTGDASDRAISRNGAMPVAFAWSASADGQIAYHGANRLIGTIDFTAPLANATGGSEQLGGVVTGDVDLAGDFAYIKRYGFHAAVMTMVWFVVIPASVFAVHMFPHIEGFNVAHRAASTSALSFTLPAAGQAMFASKDDAPESMQDAIHRYGGLAIAALMVVQVGLGTLTNLWLRGDTRPPRHWWLVKRVHRVIGYLELWAAVGNVLLGVRLLLGWFYLYVAVAFASVVALTLVTASVVVRRQRYARPPDDKPLSTAIGKPLQTVAAGTSRTHTNARRRRCCGCLMRRNQVSAAEQLNDDDAQALAATIVRSSMAMTVAEFRAALQAGRKLVLWRGLVVDVAAFMGTHPGGTFMLDRHIGSDVTSWVAGQDSNKRSTSAHVHSSVAIQLLLRMVVGSLRVDDNGGYWEAGPAVAASPTGTGAANESFSLGTASSPSAGASARFGVPPLLMLPAPQLRPRIDHDSSVFQPWTLVAKQLVSTSSSGSVFRLEFTHPLFSQQGEATSASDWSLSTLARYVLVRVPMTVLTEYVRGQDGAAATRELKKLRSVHVMSVGRGSGAGGAARSGSASMRSSLSSQSPQPVSFAAKGSSGAVLTSTSGSDGAMSPASGSVFATNPLHSASSIRVRSGSASSDTGLSPTSALAAPGSPTLLSSASLSLRVLPSASSAARKQTGSFIAGAVAGWTSSARVVTGEMIDRPYTVVRRDRSGRLVLYVKRYNTGTISRYICDAPLGASIQIRGPLGAGMHLDNAAAKDSVVVVVAQGTGLNCVFDLIQVAWARYHRAVAAKSIDAANLLPTFPGWEGEVSPARKLPVPLPAAPALTTSATAAGQGLRVSLLACFESEKSVIERAALAWFHANCPNIRVVFNVSRPTPGGGLRVASDSAPPVLSGPLTASKLVSLLPRTDLTAICCCGSPSFVEDVREIYAPLGLPRAFFTVVT